MKRKKVIRRSVEITCGWLDFSDTELSMILSHIAGGGSFCSAPGCFPSGAEAVYMVTTDRTKAEFLMFYGYEELGCDVDHRMREHYLRKTENAISEGTESTFLT